MTMQIHRSTGSTPPGSLDPGQLAYTQANKTLHIGLIGGGIESFPLGSIGVGAGGYSSTRTVSGTSDTPTAADVGTLIQSGNASATNFTINSTGLSEFDSFDVLQNGDGQLTLTPDSGMTFIPSGAQALRTKGSAASIAYLGGDTFLVVGDFEGGASSGASAEYSSDRVVSGTSDTPTSADVGNLIRTTSASPTTLTISSSGLTQFNVIDVLADGDGQVTLSPDAGMTFIPSGSQILRAKGSGASIVYLGSDRFWVVGDLETFTTDPLDLTDNAAPGTPAADTVRVFGRKIAGRMLPVFMGPSGLDSALQPMLARNKVAWANAVGNSTTLSVMGIALSATGTATSATVAVTNVHTAQRRLEYAVTTAAASAVAGWRDTGAKYFRGTAPLGGFFFVCRFGPSRGSAANATKRMFVGLSSLTAAPTDVDPSTNVTNALGVGCDAADSNFHFIHRTGTGTATKVDLGSGFAKATADNTTAYELAMFCAPGGTSVFWAVTNLDTGEVVQGEASTTLPASTTLLAPRGYMSVGGTSSVIGISLVSLYIETDL